MTETRNTTLVAARHAPGPAENGHDECFARTGHDGLCPGVATAKWLNDLGDDDTPYGGTTAGEVRRNWLRGCGAHIVAVDPARAALLDELTRASRALRDVKRRLRELDTPTAQADGSGDGNP